MNDLRPRILVRTLPAFVLLAGLALAAGPASASIMTPIHEDQPVNIYIGFSAQVPLPDLSEETLASARQEGREYAYRLGREECTLLMATIAKTCRLIDISTSAEVVQRNYGNSPLLYFSGNANFIIDLKDAVDGD